MQAFTFYASDDKLKNRGNKVSDQHTVSLFFVFCLLSLYCKGVYD